MKKAYVAHPFGGKLENKTKVENKIKELITLHPGVNFISPIHAFDYLYDSIEYVEGMKRCFDLLEACDELILCEGWEESRGCNMEYAYARAIGMEVNYEQPQ